MVQPWFNKRNFAVIHGMAFSLSPFINKNMKSIQIWADNKASGPKVIKLETGLRAQNCKLAIFIWICIKVYQLNKGFNIHDYISTW